jgi:hypothetical protein
MEEKLKELVDRYDVKIINLRGEIYRLLIIYDIRTERFSTKYFDGKTIPEVVEKAYQWYLELKNAN